MIEKAKNAKALLDGIPSADRKDPGYIFSRAMWLRRADKIAEASHLMLSAPIDPKALIDPDPSMRKAALKAILWLSAEFNDDEVSDRTEDEWVGMWGWWN